jgi:hypothetical protein
LPSYGPIVYGFLRFNAALWAHDTSSWLGPFQPTKGDLSAFLVAFQKNSGRYHLHHRWFCNRDSLMLSKLGHWEGSRF